MVIFDGNQAISNSNKYELLYPIYVEIVNFLVVWHHFYYFYLNEWLENPSKSMNSVNVPISPFYGIPAFYPPLFKNDPVFLIIFMPIISRKKSTGDNPLRFEL